MSDFVVPVKEIKDDVVALPNSDNLTLIKIDGYVCISSKLDDGSYRYKKGDRVVYIPESAVVPVWLLKKLDLWNEEAQKGMLHGAAGNIVKAKRLRGTFSQGLLVGLKNNNLLELQDGSIVKVALEEDCAKHLGMEKYEAPIPKTMGGDQINLQKYTMKFDFENYQSRPSIFTPGEEVYATEKIHGCADADTIIETLEYGPTKIKDLVGKDGCHIKSFDVHTNEVVYELLEGTSVLENNNNWYEIELENGTIIKLTGNHPVWLPDLQCYRKVENLVGNENVLMENIIFH